MPSPTERMVPTSARSVSTSYCSIRCRRIDVISSGRNFTNLSAPHEFLSQTFQSSAHACIRAIRACLQHDAADEVGVDAPRRLHLTAGRFLDLRDDRLRLGVGQLACGRQLDRQAPFLARQQPLELDCDGLDLPRPALLGDELEEVPQQRLVVAGEVGEDPPLRGRLELRVAQDGAKLGRLLDRLREVGERLVHLLQSLAVLRGAEERFGVDAVSDGYFVSSSREKSREPIASVMSSRSRSVSSARPTTIEVASSVRSATSVRICSSARAVSALISFRVSSRRRWRSVSVSSRMRSSIESRVLRASLRISSAWLLASPISRRCSSSRLFAWSRALSASSIERRICCWRSSMSRWIEPNAYFRRTKKTIRKKMIVQIISPGMIFVSGLEAATSIYLTRTKPRKPPTRP